MNKNVSFILVLFFLCGLFVSMLNPVSAEFVEDSWVRKTSMNFGRIDSGVVAVDGKIYVIGGYANHGNTTGFVGTNERYDPVTDVWFTLTSMPTPRLGFAIVAYENKIYCMGGNTADETTAHINEVYDIASDSWITKTPVPISEMFVKAHVVNGKIFVVTQQVLYVYDPIEDSWTNKTNTPTQRVHAISVVVDNKIIIVDQIPQEKVDNEYTAIALNVSVYDEKSDTWSERQTSPEYTCRTDDLQLWLMRPIAAGATTGVYASQKIYVLFGAINYVYDVIEDTWSTATCPEPAQFVGCNVAVIEDILYAVGVTYTTSHGNAGIMQYVPFGHKKAVSTPEPSNPTTMSPVTPEPSNTHTSEQPEPSERTLIYISITALVIAITSIVIGFFYISKKNHMTIAKIPS
jgi:N-acetylneuraminic acid mutarotase